LNNIYRYQLSCNNITIKPESLLQSLGYPQSTAPDEILKLINQEIKNLEDFCLIKGGYRIMNNIEINSDKSLLIIGKSEFNLKKIIFNQIKKSTSVALFVCTVGSEMEKKSGNLMKSGEPLLGYIIDVIASEAVEKAMDIIQDKLATQMKKQGLNITNRFSPGYCGWHVSEQQKLFSLLPHEFCGIKLTPSSLMVPIKSISGIVGIGREVKKNIYPCRVCDVKDCIRRK
jgi:hypothetical protein